ncbi:hypothetical protein L596_022532 [Steinernema carpocapsae]|uniref:Uncharacterized protein n=1 Tax=Steinernema carpocapsae TaxID=34508 RepID=A0A4U5MM00_STECR|nr:hypothetical protein L596_022532 [Steinernema carpocapsae]
MNWFKPFSGFVGASAQRLEAEGHHKGFRIQMGAFECFDYNNFQEKDFSSAVRMKNLKAKYRLRNHIVSPSQRNILFFPLTVFSLQS